jgi:hypothetical protein
MSSWPLFRLIMGWLAAMSLVDEGRLWLRDAAVLLVGEGRAGGRIPGKHINSIREIFAEMCSVRSEN